MTSATASTTTESPAAAPRSRSLPGRVEEQSFAARLLGSIDLFIVWWTVSLAIGLGVLYRKRTAPIATTLLAVYVAIGITAAAIKTVLAGA
jgi:hypothetical protein